MAVITNFSVFNKMPIRESSSCQKQIKPARNICLIFMNYSKKRDGNGFLSSDYYAIFENLMLRPETL